MFSFALYYIAHYTYFNDEKRIASQTGQVELKHFHQQN